MLRRRRRCSGRYDDAGKDVGAGAGRYAMAVRYNPTANDYVKDVAAANANDRIVFVAVVRDWEKVYEAGAPYQDARGTFYLHYVGEGDGFGLVDVQEEMDADGGTAYGQGTTLLGVSVTSTYKMFDGLPAGRVRGVARHVASDACHVWRHKPSVVRGRPRRRAPR